jgi:uncharacterized protein with FMN-binding domain
MPLLRWVLLILGLGAFLFAGVRSHLTRPEPFVPDPRLLRAVAPVAPALERTVGPHGTYFTDEGGGAPAALAYLTDQVDPEVKGYAGEISLLAAIDRAGALTGVRLIEHSETPSYMKEVIASGFLERLAGRKLGADLAGVDAVTGATVTCNAIREDILRGGALLAKEGFGIEVSGVPSSQGFFESALEPRSLALIGAMALAIVAFSIRSFRAGRAVSLAAGLVVLGLWINIPLSTAHFTNVALLKIPASSNAPLILLLAFVLVTGLVFRSRVYCDYLCPFSAVQEAAYALTKRRPKVSERVWRAASVTRHLLLFVIVILASIGGFHAVGAMEPYVFLFNPEAKVLPWLYVGAVVTASFFVRRFWCRIFCPCGVCVELVASIRRRRGRKTVVEDSR